jgi:long-chain acyl-CoA synthetase
MTRFKKVATPWYKWYGKRKKTIKYPKTSMYDEVQRAAKTWPELTALSYFGNHISYDTLVTEIDKAARGFISLGAKKGDTISLCSANVPEAIIALYAINKIGCIVNVFHPLSAPNEIRDYLNLGGGNLFVTIDVAWPNVKQILHETSIERVIVISPADSLPILPKFGYKFLNIKEIRKELAQILIKNELTMNWHEFLGRGRYVTGNAYEKMKAEDVAVILYSGGTTGKPKGAALSNMSFNATAYQAKDFFSTLLKPGAVMLGIMPIFHGFGLGCGFHAMLCWGASTAMIPKLNIAKFDRLLADIKPSFLVGVPTLYEVLLKSRKIRNMDLSFIQAAISGGDSLPPPLKHEVDALLAKNGSKAKVIEGYGLVECLSVAIVNPLDNQRDGSIGIPFPDVLVKIVEPSTYIEKKYGEIGEIVLNGPTIMTGFVNDAKETNEILQMHPDGRVWLHTGDLGYMTRDGFVYFVQRLKRMIVTSGYNVYPSEVEAAITAVPEILSATVVGVDSKHHGQDAVAFVVPKENIKVSKELEERIMASCRDNLAKYKWPRRIEFRKTLPKTKIGKVAYRELAKEASQQG